MFVVEQVTFLVRCLVDELYSPAGGAINHLTKNFCSAGVRLNKTHAYTLSPCCGSPHVSAGRQC